MENSNTLQLLIQGGAVGISIALIALIYWVVKIGKEIISNHLGHTNKVLLRMTKAIEKLAVTLDIIDKRNKKSTE